MQHRISVIMGIYNCADTLPEAIESILSQTCSDWQLIMCDDGSADHTYAVADQYRRAYPDQIVLLKNEQNLGLNATLNRCLAAAEGDYIARMDGDDISLPDRFEKEIAVLDSMPEIAIVSTAMIYFDESGEWGRCSVNSRPQPDTFLQGTPFCHAPCMVRREAYEAVNGYTEERKFLRVEDYELWVKMYAKGYRGMNLCEPLYRMRDDRNAAARRKYRYRINEFRVRCRAVHLLKLPLYGYICALRPLIVGLLPYGMYQWLHKTRLKVIS